MATWNYLNWQALAINGKHWQARGGNMELSQLAINGKHWQAQGGNMELFQRSCESNSHLENPRSIPSLTTRSGNDWQILKHLPLIRDGM